MAFYVPHIDGGFAEIDMTVSEQSACQQRCAAFGDPPCWELPGHTSDAPREIRPCDHCKRRPTPEPQP